MGTPESDIFNVNVFKKYFSDCLDTTFVICSISLPQYGPKKFEDVFNQIFPTSIALKSAYWPFYKHTESRCLCICEKYGIFCNHVVAPGSVHCLNLTIDAKYHEDRFLFSTGKIRPVSYNITCLPTPVNLPKGYLVSARIFIKGCERAFPNKQRRRQPLDYFIINSRYAFAKKRASISTGYEFKACPDLKKSADLILDLKSETDFPENIVRGYKLEAEEFPLWIACAGMTQMNLRTYEIWNRYKERAAFLKKRDGENQTVDTKEKNEIKVVFAENFPAELIKATNIRGNLVRLVNQPSNRF